MEHAALVEGIRRKDTVQFVEMQLKQLKRKSEKEINV